jgi:hypothetical protein
MRHAALFGPAAATVDQVSAALEELNQVRLAPRYEVNGKAYVFLPGRFEHNQVRKYWRRSQHPLPPTEMLAEYPEYARPLALLTTKSEIRHTMRTGEARRYPHLAHHMPEFDGQPMGNAVPTVGLKGESSVDLGSRIIGLGEEGDSSSSVHEPTRAAAGGAAPESPPVVACAPPEPRRDKIASQTQQRFAARLLGQYGRSLADWLAAKGCHELMDSHVDEIRAHYGGRQMAPVSGPRAHEAAQAPDPDLSAEERTASAAALAKLRRSTGNTGVVGRRAS